MPIFPGRVHRAALGRLLPDILLSAGAFVVFQFMLWGIISGAGLSPLLAIAFSPLLLLAPALVYLSPVIVMLVGFTGRIGFVIGPPITVALLFLVSIVYRQFDVAAATAYATPAITEPPQGLAILAYDQASGDCGPKCDPAILMRSPFAIARSIPAMRGQKPSWSVFKRSSGAECRADPKSSNIISFLEAGYLDACEIKTTEADIDHALIVRERQINERFPPQDVPHLFVGQIYDVNYVVDGKETLLEHQLLGAIGSELPNALMFYGLRPKKIRFGPEVNLEALTAWALHTSVEELDEPPAGTKVTDLLDSIESYLETPSVSQDAVGAWMNVARGRGGDDPSEVMTRIERFLSNNAGPHLQAGMGTVQSMRWPVPAGHRPKLRDALQALLTAAEQSRGHWVYIDFLRTQLRRFSNDN
jgi:hypothetical protein